MGSASTHILTVSSTLTNVDVTFSYLVICAALVVVAIPTSLRKRSVVVSTSTVLPLSRQAQPARFRCTLPYSLLLPLSSSILKDPADCQCLDSGGYNLAAQ